MADDDRNSLETYELQLGQVQQALKTDPNCPDLVQLQQDLQQLISLTMQSLLEAKKNLLLSKLPRCDEADTNQDLQALENDLKQLVGKKCKAPHTSRGSGSTSFHNAIIFHNESENNVEFNDVLIRVVFSHPTSTDMVPCPFYLEGKCRFADAECRYSHGEIVKLADLSEFQDPDYEGLLPGGTVLAKGVGDNLWHHAKVEAIETTKVFIRFSHDHKNVEKVDFEDVFPLTSDCYEDDASDMVSDPDSNFAPSNFAPLSTLDNLSSSSLGNWEVHTTGVASKLMAKMGYIVGTGLGKNSDGRVEPVPAMIYPVGKSLDWCMEMREKAGGGDMLSVEKTLKRQQEREARKMLKQQESGSKQASVFDFINKRLAGKRGTSEDADALPGPSKHKTPLQVEPSLNVQTFKLSEDIRRVEKDVAHLKASHKRLVQRDPKSAADVEKKISAKTEQLNKLRSTEATLINTKAQKKSSKKLAVF